MRTLKQNSGAHEHLSQYVLMCMHYCRLCILNLWMLHVLYTLLLSHSNPQVKNTSPLPCNPPCTNPDKNIARSRIPEMNWASENHEEALQLLKQTRSYCCKDEDITDPGKIALKILRGIGNEGLKRLNASGMSDADKKRPDKTWELSLS